MCVNGVIDLPMWDFHLSFIDIVFDVTFFPNYGGGDVKGPWENAYNRLNTAARNLLSSKAPTPVIPPLRLTAPTVIRPKQTAGQTQPVPISSPLVGPVVPALATLGLDPRLSSSSKGNVLQPSVQTISMPTQQHVSSTNPQYASPLDRPSSGGEKQAGTSLMGETGDQIARTPSPALTESTDLSDPPNEPEELGDVAMKGTQL